MVWFVGLVFLFFQIHAHVLMDIIFFLGQSFWDCELVGACLRGCVGQCCVSIAIAGMVAMAAEPCARRAQRELLLRHGKARQLRRCEQNLPAAAAVAAAAPSQSCVRGTATTRAG